MALSEDQEATLLAYLGQIVERERLPNAKDEPSETDPPPSALKGLKKKERKRRRRQREERRTENGEENSTQVARVNL